MIGLILNNNNGILQIALLDHKKEIFLIGDDRKNAGTSCMVGIDCYGEYYLY